MTDKKYPIGVYAPGSHQCTCCVCGRGFFGDKRAVQCEPCATKDLERYNALTEDEKAEHDQRFREAVKEVFERFNSPQS